MNHFRTFFYQCRNCRFEINNPERENILHNSKYECLSQYRFKVQYWILQNKVRFYSLIFKLFSPNICLLIGTRKKNASISAKSSNESVIEDSINVTISLPTRTSNTSEYLWVAGEFTESTISIQKAEEKEDQNKAINSDQSSPLISSYEADESTESLKLQIISNSNSMIKHQEVRYNK